MSVRSGMFAPLALALVISALVLGGCTTPEPGLDRGRAVFNTCVPCHGSAGQGQAELGAPAIAGLPAWYVLPQLQKFEAGWRGAHPMDTVGLRMKSMARAFDREGDRESVAEYVASLPRVVTAVTITGGDVERGREGYNRTCVPCHGPDARGVEPVQGPPLVGQDDWYLLRQFQHFRKGWRGAHPDDLFGQTMAANAQLYTDDEVRDILAYLRTLQ